jgi:hypothetical protein
MTIGFFGVGTRLTFRSLRIEMIRLQNQFINKKYDSFLEEIGDHWYRE